MKKITVLFCSCCLWGASYALQNDPVVMKINGKDVSRSEFEYNFNKNNGDEVVEKKSVDEYVDLFVNYKLKVEAALDAQYDTLTSFKKEFATYRDQQVRPYLVSPAAEEAEVRKYYEKMKSGIGPEGLILPAHIMVMISQKATPEEQAKAKARIDSIYTALQGGADFEKLAQQCSDDKASARRGGALSWIAKGQTIKEFEDKAFALEKGEMSDVVLTPMGYHIILMKDRKQLESYEELKNQIKPFLEQRGLRDHIARMAVDSLVKASAGSLTAEEVMNRKAQEVSAGNKELRYLIQEYHDGLLLYEISTREIWDKAAKDEAGLQAYFKDNKSKYKWEAPRYKGVVYHCKEASQVKDVRKLLKKVDEAQWIDSLRATFNRDSVQQIRVEKNIFKQGDNVFVDHLVFKEKPKPEALKKFPYMAVYGKKMKRPKEWTDVRGEVVSDYQTAKEEEFVRNLREKYKVEIYKEVLNTVNKH